VIPIARTEWQHTGALSPTGTACRLTHVVKRGKIPRPKREARNPTLTITSTGQKKIGVIRKALSIRQPAVETAIAATGSKTAGVSYLGVYCSERGGVAALDAVENSPFNTVQNK
jgi:hypothetical protein